MEEQTDPRIKQFGEYIARKVAEQTVRSFNPQEDGRLRAYQDVRTLYEQTFQVVLSQDVESYERTYAKLYQTQVADLEFSVRTRNCLKFGGIVNLSQLVKLSERELSELRSWGGTQRFLMGETSLNEIKLKLTELGLSLRTD